MGLLKAFYGGLIALGQGIQDLLLLGLRLYWGWGFFQTGLGKLRDIQPVITYFKSLGIPFPEFSSPFVGSVECVGGALLILGLASRFVSIPLIFVMMGAYIAAFPEGAKALFSNPELFIKQPPFYFLVTALAVFIFGPGRLSLDALLDRTYFKSGKV